MARTKILVVEDDSKIRALLRNVMEAEGFCVEEAATADETLSLIRTSPPDLITLDINLGADNGLEMARDIRRITQVPIIMVTGKNDVIDRVVGLEIGADDYITKPFHVREVIARVRSVLRRTGGDNTPDQSGSESQGVGHMETGKVFHFDGITASPELLELRDRNGMNCALTSGDFKLLAIFMERPKRVLSRDQLMGLTGGTHRSPMDRTIDNQVARLRKKIERDPANPKLIKTVRGVGYTFACDVKVAQAFDAPVKSA